MRRSGGAVRIPSAAGVSGDERGPVGADLAIERLRTATHATAGDGGKVEWWGEGVWRIVSILDVDGERI